MVKYVLHYKSWITFMYFWTILFSFNKSQKQLIIAKFSWVRCGAALDIKLKTVSEQQRKDVKRLQTYISCSWKSLCNVIENATQVEQRQVTSVYNGDGISQHRNKCGKSGKFRRTVGRFRFRFNVHKKPIEKVRSCCMHHNHNSSSL